MSSVIDVLIGERICKLRKDAGLSRIDLANKAGVYPAELASWEIGETPISASHLYALVTDLGCTVRDIYAGVEQMGQKDEIIGVAQDVADLSERTPPESSLDGVDARASELKLNVVSITSGRPIKS